MRSSPEMLDLPYTFTQLPLVAADNFGSLARGRDVLLDRWRLEAVHRLGLLVPLFRVKRPTAEIRAAFRRGDEHRAHVLANREPKRRDDLLEASDAGLLFDAATKPVHSRQSLAREIDGYKYEASVYLYSQHQLACLWPLRWLMSSITWRRRGASLTAQLKMDPASRGDWLRQAQTLREAVIAVLALEPVYYSRVIGTLRTAVDFDIDAFLRWRFELEPRWLLDWLDVDSDWVGQRASDIFGQAQRLDKLGGWSEVIGASAPQRWEELEGRRGW